jgi:N-methylhydantoinase A
VDADLEIVSLRCRAIGHVAPPEIRAIPEAARQGAKPRRDVHFREAGGFVSCPVMQRASFAPGYQVLGPAIIDEWSTTTVVHPGWQASGDSFGNLVLEPIAQGDKPSCP